jgi:PTH2 family peptidyl-tRNA hydrolase
MRLAVFLSAVLVPAITVAQEQKPLREHIQFWFDTAKAYIPASLTSPLDAGAARIASKNVVVLDKDNWYDAITATGVAAAAPKPWMVLVSGGNKTCYGQCGDIETAWNKSVALLAADLKSPNLGYINCDISPILCAIWYAGPPAIWYIEVPADPKVAPTPIHVVPLITNSTTPRDIVEIHTQKRFLDRPSYEGAFHPWDGYLAKAKLNIPAAYVLYAFSLVPSWTFMLLVSFVSRTIM